MQILTSTLSVPLNRSSVLTVLTAGRGKPARLTGFDIKQNPYSVCLQAQADINKHTLLWFGNVLIACVKGNAFTLQADIKAGLALQLGQTQADIKKANIK